MKSKLNIKSILIIAIIGIFSLVFFNKSFAAVTGMVNVDVANIRQTTDSSSTILEQASKGESIQIIEKSGNWYKVKYNGVQGYVRQDLVDVSDNDAEIAVSTNNTTTETTQNNTETSVAQNAAETASTEEVANTTEETSAENSEAVQNTETQHGDTATENQTTANDVEGIYTTIDSVKLKIMPLVNGNDIKEIQKDATINVLEVYNNWALAENGLDRGWVLYSKIQKVDDENSTVAETEIAEQEEENQEEEKEEVTEQEDKQETTEVAVQETTMYVNSEVVNLRKSATISSESLAKLNIATEVTVVATDDDWSKVKVNEKEGYIKTSLLSERKPEVTTSRSLEQERQPVATIEAQVSSTETITQSAVVETAPVATSASSDIGQQVCSYAKQFLGCKYVYGGTSPTSGFDCSGFTQYVFKNFGVTLNRTAEAQASNGTYVAKADLKAGDLLIFTSHAGIYLGDGTFIHAANPSKGVIITSLFDSYYVSNYITARRIFN